MVLIGSILRSLVTLLLVAIPIRAQNQQLSPSAKPLPPEQKRILWIIPNYRTSPLPNPYMRLVPEQKFKIATEDSFDRGTMALAALFAGQSLLVNSNPAFGRGFPGYARYLGTSYADLVIGDYMTEALYPTLFRQDPRYFRRGTGSGWSRLGYAISQIFVTHGDSGRMQINFSELVGNSTAVAISNSYYQDRTVSNAVSKLGVQLGVDMAANILKEFWPDLNRKLSKKGRDEKRGGGDRRLGCLIANRPV